MRTHLSLRARRVGRMAVTAVSAIAMILPAAVMWPASQAAAETTTIVDQFGTTAGDWGEAVVADSSGNVYVFGDTEGTLPGQTHIGSGDMFLRKYTSAGAVVWTVQFGSTGYDYADGIAVDGSGNVYVTGDVGPGALTGCSPACTSVGDRDAFVRQYTPSGEVGWSRQFGFTDKTTSGYGVVVSSGYVYVDGYTTGAFPGYENPDNSNNSFVRQYSTADGTEGWIRQIGGTNTDGTDTWSVDDSAWGLAADSSGNLYLVGEVYGSYLNDCTPDPCTSSNNNADAYVRQYTSTGALGWTRQFSGGPGTDTSWVNVAVDSLGNVDVGGQTSGTLAGQTSSGSDDGFVLQYSGTGTLNWTRQFGTSVTDGVDMVAVDSAGNVYATGGSGAVSSGFVSQWTSGGTPGWSRQFEAGSSASGNGVAVDGSGNIYATGGTDGALPGFSSAGAFDAYLVKFSTSPAKATSVALAASPEPSDPGSSVTYTATVAPSSGTLDGGTVTFFEGGSPICAAASVNTGTGQATCTVTNYSTAGIHTVSAEYSGTSNFDLSWGYTTHTVGVATTTTLSSDPEPSAPSQIVTYTATVTPLTGPLDGGTVDFKQDGISIAGCSAVAVNTSTGIATCAVTYNAASGEYAITATYSGTGMFVGSTSARLYHEVAQIGTGTTLNASADPSIVGGSLTYTATVTPDNGTLNGGTVDFQQDGSSITGCDAVTVNTSTGVATCSASNDTVGLYWIDAIYSGTAAMAGSSATTIMHTVTYGVDAGTKRITTRPGGTLRFKMMLTDASGADLSSSDVSLGGLDVYGPYTWAGTVNVSYVASRRSPYYQFTVSVPRTQQSGTYTLTFQPSDDPMSHEISITVK